MTATRSADRTIFVEEVMGTVASMDIRDSVADLERQAAARAAMTTLRGIDDQFSAFHPASEVSRYASGLLDEADLSHDLREVLRICSVLTDASNGVFRWRRPESRSLDVAGLVKGWAIDRAGETLRRQGMRNWCLTVGGDVLVSGGPGLASNGSGMLSGDSEFRSGGSELRSEDEERGPWRVAVRDPFDPKRVRAVLPVVGRAVATSGSYERGAHVWDGRSGRRVPTEGSFTVVGPFMTFADAYATIGYVMGSDGLAWVARHPGYEALRVAPDGSLSATRGIELPEDL